MSKIFPKGKDLFTDRGPSACLLTTNNLTGEHVALIKKDKRSVSEIVKAYEQYNLVTEKLIKDIRTKKKGKYRRANYT